jgi:hypothetical protein
MTMTAKKAKRQHLTPCAQCPWRKTSAPGWLGSSTPLQFLAQAEADLKMPCHCAVNYEKDDWRAQAEQAPRCAGHAIFLRNRGKLPRDRDLAAFVGQVERNDAVFTNPAEFVTHHGGDARRVSMVLLGFDAGDP